MSLKVYDVSTYRKKKRIYYININFGKLAFTRGNTQYERTSISLSPAQHSFIIYALDATCLTEIFRTSKRVCGSSINVSHVEKGILCRDSGFPGISYSFQFSAILRDLHRESIPLFWISSLFTSFRIQLTIPVCLWLNVILHIFHLEASHFKCLLRITSKRCWEQKKIEIAKGNFVCAHIRT